MYEETRDWVVIQTFWRKEMLVAEFLKEKGITHFIPMTYKECYVAGQDKPKKCLVPVIHNYVFAEKTMPVKEFQAMLGECKVPVHLMKNKGSDVPCEVSNRDMFEFRVLCDPDFDRGVIVREGEEDADIGREVVVVHGPFTGIKGRLLRKQHKYWFIKTIAGVSVMLRITRWYCKSVEK